MDFYYISGVMFGGVLFVLFSFLLSRLISPRIPTANKTTPYECGEVPLGPAWTRFNVGYYVFALLFLLFEVEGFTHGEIARILGIPEGTSKTFLFDAKKKLQRWLATRPGSRRTVSP